MFEYLFSIFDIPLACILILLAVFGMLFIKNIFNAFLSLFTSIFLIIFIASTMLTQQIYLGEFLVISIFFILTIVFFVFNLNNNFDDSSVVDDKKSKLKIFLAVLVAIFLFSIIGFNFKRIDNTNNKFVVRNSLVKDDLKLQNDKDDQSYDSYVENISLLNQNKIFQKLTHIIMFYVCLVVVLYFFNRRNDNNER